MSRKRLWTTVLGLELAEHVDKRALSLSNCDADTRSDPDRDVSEPSDQREGNERNGGSSCRSDVTEFHIQLMYLYGLCGLYWV